MKPMESPEIKLCQLQARIFEESVKKTACSSPVFIRRFVHSSVAETFDDRSYLFQANTAVNVFAELDEEFGPSEYGKIKYSEDQMFWIGYIYRCFCIVFGQTSKQVFKRINGREIVKYYKVYHTFDPVDAVERIAENIGFSNTGIQEYSLQYLKKLYLLDDLKDMIGKRIDVVVERQSADTTKSGPDYILSLGCGQIEGLRSIGGDPQEAYIICKERPSDIFSGKVLAVANRKDDLTDRLIVCDENENYTNADIRKMIDKSEQQHKYRIIRKAAPQRSR